MEPLHVDFFQIFGVQTEEDVSGSSGMKRFHFDAERFLILTSESVPPYLVNLFVFFLKLVSSVVSLETFVAKKLLNGFRHFTEMKRRFLELEDF